MEGPKVMLAISFFLLCLCHCMSSGNPVDGGGTIKFQVSNKCPFPIWPAIAPSAGQPVIADGGFFLATGQAMRVKAPLAWSGRFWARTACNFTNTTKPGCQTGDCQGLIACNGTIGLPPATLIEVSLQSSKTMPSFFHVTLIDGYNLPVSISTRPTNPHCLINGCTKSINSVCPEELKVLDQNGMVVACKSACLAFKDDSSCCRNLYGKPESCLANKYSKIFKDACPSYFSYAFDTPPPVIECFSKNYIITFCPSKWSTHQSM